MIFGIFGQGQIRPGAFSHRVQHPKGKVKGRASGCRAQPDLQNAPHRLRFSTSRISLESHEAFDQALHRPAAGGDHLLEARRYLQDRFEDLGAYEPGRE